MTTEAQTAVAATNEDGGKPTTEDPTPATGEPVVEGEPKGAAPEPEVDYTFAPPEGVEFDTEDLTKFTDIAKTHKLPKEAAQAVVDLAAAREKARAEAHFNQVSAWADTVTKDPELGKAENLATAKGVIDTFGSPDLIGLLDSTGLGNHPEVVRLALKIGKALSEDALVTNRQGEAPGKRALADVLYGTPKN